MSTDQVATHATPTDPTSLVYRTARAIYEAEHLYATNKVPQFEHVHPTMLKRYERMARAALDTALREPVSV